MYYRLEFPSQKEAVGLHKAYLLTETCNENAVPYLLCEGITVENKWKHVEHSCLVELARVRGSKSGIVVYLVGSEVDGSICDSFLKVP
jgi:hypothetical protein